MDDTSPSVSSSSPSSEEKGSLGIFHVKQLWSRTLKKRSGQSSDRTSDSTSDQISAEEWVKDNTLICGLRLGLRETFEYLHGQNPSLEQFENWILERNGGV